jgi:2-amino-4-hydroxy-6-hydroxymethyldihydropteridine diphosphokinase
MALLRCINNVEERMGRPTPPRHGPRLIDIDILLFGDETVHLPELTIPHPRMATRAFVLRPLCDVLESGWLREHSRHW